MTQLAPGEPAGWANWGVLAFRQRNFDVAAQRYERARDLASKNDQIYYLLGILQSTRGNSKEAIADWRKAVAINPQNYRAAYQLALEVEREGGPGSDAEFESLIQNILKAQPDNLAAWLELARAAAKRGDAATLKSALDAYQRASLAVASGSAAASCDVAGCGGWRGYARGCHANDFSAQHFDARCGVPRKSCRAAGGAGRRGRAVHAFSAIGIAGVRSGAGGFGADVYTADRRESGRESGGEALVLDWRRTAGQRWSPGHRGSEWPRGASFNRRDISLSRRGFWRGASARRDFAD